MDLYGHIRRTDIRCVLRLHLEVNAWSLYLFWFLLFFTTFLSSVHLIFSSSFMFNHHHLCFFLSVKILYASVSLVGCAERAAEEWVYSVTSDNYPRSLFDTVCLIYCPVEYEHAAAGLPAERLYLGHGRATIPHIACPYGSPKCSRLTGYLHGSSLTKKIKLNWVSQNH